MNRLRTLMGGVAAPTVIVRRYSKGTRVIVRVEGKDLTGVVVRKVSYQGRRKSGSKDSAYTVLLDYGNMYHAALAEMSPAPAEGAASEVGNVMGPTFGEVTANVIATVLKAPDVLAAGVAGFAWDSGLYPHLEGETAVDENEQKLASDESSDCHASSI